MAGGRIIFDYAIAMYEPDSWKGYTVGDNTHKNLAHWPYHLDDEKLMYPFYEKALKAGIVNICLHKGLSSGNCSTRIEDGTAA
jgi:hypothetical protein